MAREIAEHELYEWLKHYFVSARTNYIKQHMKQSVSTIIVISTSTQYFKKFLRKTNTEMKMVSNFTTHCLILLRKIPCIFILDF